MRRTLPIPDVILALAEPAAGVQTPRPTSTVFYWLLARAPATRVALISYLIPIVAVVIGAVAFDEPLRPRLLAGSALVLAGVGLVSALRLRRAPPAALVRRVH